VTEGHGPRGDGSGGHEPGSAPLAAPVGPEDLGPDGVIRTILRVLRTHLELDVAFVSHLHTGTRVVRHLDARPGAPVAEGTTDPWAQALCWHAVTGNVPALLVDPAAHPLAGGLATTRRMAVGTHLAAPIVLSDGTLHGALSTYAHTVRDDLDRRDLSLVRTLAAVIADRVEDAEARRRRRAVRRAELEAIVPGTDLRLVFQPIVELATERTVAVEALSRFPHRPGGPAPVFDEAWALGAGLELELTVVAAALDALERLPDPVVLSLNVAPETLSSSELPALLDGHPADRLVFEVTEHAAVSDYAVLAEGGRRVRDLGARLAVDDVGTGFSGLDHILRLGPDVLKLDGQLIRDLDRCGAKRAMVEALHGYAARTDTALVAERIETEAERAVLTELGVSCGQGYLLGRPGELPVGA
jgi:EAL domain-containing protein (putative c-di-GMP-specific phosphodiesterase class I)